MSENLYPHEWFVKYLNKNIYKIEYILFFILVGAHSCGYLVYKNKLFLLGAIACFLCGVIWNHYDYKLRGIQ